MYGKYGKSCWEMVAKNGRFPAKIGGLESLDDPCYTRQFSGNLSRNSIAKQAAEKIMQCKSAGPSLRCMHTRVVSCKLVFKT